MDKKWYVMTTPRKSSTTESSSCFSFGGRTERDIDVVPKENEDDALLARDLNALTLEERNQVYEEVHGVNKILAESKTFVKERIAAMKAELLKYPVAKRRSFDRACFLRPTLENDDKLFLMFLRSERFDEHAAARKLCLHFDHKLELFGAAKLPKTITLEDLDEDDLEVFKTGSYIILPKKDRSGRQPQLLNLPRLKFKDWRNQVRYTWYIVFTILLADEENQKKGIVDVLYFVDMKGIPDSMLQYVRDSHHILSAMPVRSCGFHVCYNNNLIRSFLSFLHVVTPKERKLRERVHFGSHLEVEYQLRTFGIDLRDLETGDSAETFGDDYFEKFLQSRRTIEAETKRMDQELEKQTGVILYPNPMDVLCGRGRPYQDFPGNIRVGEMVDEQVPTYLKTSERTVKTMIANGIVERVKEAGGRFLTRRKDGWKIADEKVARGKISQALRVRTLKLVRTEGMEPSPLPVHSHAPATLFGSTRNTDIDSIRDPKRLRCSDTSDYGEDEDEDNMDDLELLRLEDGLDICHGKGYFDR